jgi:hypothetical protein
LGLVEHCQQDHPCGGGEPVCDPQVLALQVKAQLKITQKSDPIRGN